MKLNKQQYQQLESELNHIKNSVMSDLGQKDANYIRRIILIQRLCEILGRASFLGVLLHPIFWIIAVLLLSLAKILDNMEIGHNVLHGQYDWMNDPTINSQNYEWDLVGDAHSWRIAHNFEHHTFTNIIGKDRDFGYGLLRMSHDFSWKPKNLWQFFTFLSLCLIFEWGIAYQSATERVAKCKNKLKQTSLNPKSQLTKRFLSKSFRQIFKDYIFYPLICWPVFLPVLLGNFVANLIRNLWTSTIIFCGHFTDGIQTFTEEECKNESKGQWYYRQVLGSSNLTGHRWFHIMTGHLSCQIEHHLFPDIPAHRYVEIAPKVQQVLEKHQIPYNTGSFFKQYSTVLKRIFKYSFPERKKLVEVEK